MNLIDETKRLIASAPRNLTLRQIAAASKVKADWLSQFNRGVIPEPSAVKVQRVYDYLSSLKA